MITVDYNKTLLHVRILKVYIDDVKQIREDLSDERMQLEFCGYNMKLKRFTIKNACALKYHVDVQQKKIRMDNRTTY